MRPFAFAFAIAAGLLVSGCGSSEEIDAKGDTPGQVAEKVAAAGMTPRPGRWQGTFRVEKVGIPGLPPQAADQMNKQMGMERSYFSCLTPEHAAKPDARFFQKAAEGCVYDRFTMADGKIDAVMTCKPGAGPTRMAMNGTYGADTYDLKITGSGELAKNMPMSIAMAVTSRRVGECDGTEE